MILELVSWCSLVLEHRDLIQTRLKRKCFSTLINFYFLSIFQSTNKKANENKHSHICHITTCSITWYITWHDEFEWWRRKRLPLLQCARRFCWFDTNQAGRRSLPCRCYWLFYSMYVSLIIYPFISNTAKPYKKQ